ncbi:two-component system OmpR family sensor kinase [Streptomyces sp. KhCrAH-43]|uniref:sensor histidine kinase n=1 Tax=unclassified Streptomyces TaxID=2593676 RepID=UPI000378D4ED|nr:HAMP domain-containing sensor histidine kinase [Streptomyces sp. KhCrAH-43]MYS39434.1 HAMP domain-containing protein [Streptomyces sp. SID4920]MYX69749.1 HAMP domain-containing protein [Streptomyces sp. SID8373]RAJ59688.1 two-component system OmpR family sensor kinase [Streptomyces sp. KhCrAH-43]
MRLLPRRPRSVRTRLVLISTVLATAAVLVSQAAGLAVMRSWLTGQIDHRLAQFRPPPPAAYGRPPHGPVPEDALPSDFRVFFYASDGRLRSDSLGSGTGRPRLPASASGSALERGRPVTVPDAGGGADWRVVARTGPDGRSVVVALPLDTVEGATSKLLWFSLAIGVVTAAGVGLLGSAAVRLGLRPLARMERTALRITGGESALTVTDTDPRTETGRLGIAFNTMLGQVRAALRRKDASEQRLRRFMADAGHELRTPLTSIQGFAELLVVQPRLPAARRREAHELIARNAERMSRLVDDLFLLAKLGYAPVAHRETVDLLSLAADGVGAAVVAHPGREVRLAPLGGGGADGPGPALDVVEALGDAHQLSQVIGNLLANACRHTPPGARVEVRVGAVRTGPETGGTDRPGRSSAAAALPAGVPACVVEVADDGPGLADDVARQVFERFYRGPAASGEGIEPGSGLGLSIAATVAEAHGGRLELDTRPGYGCVFRLLLPRSVGPGPYCPA